MTQQRLSIQQFAAEVSQSLAGHDIEIAPGDVHLERPARAEHGDWSTNAALTVAKRAGRNPRELADLLAQDLRGSSIPHLVSVEVAGPGFVNFTLAPGWLHEVLRQVVTEGVDDYARLDVGGGEKVSVEFVSANPTGPLHAGGGRWGAYGDTLVRLSRRCGFQPHSEYYINDRGNQMELFAKSLLARRTGQPLPEEGYMGEYVTQWAEEMPAELVEAATASRDEAALAEALDEIGKWGRDRSLRDVKEALGAMGVKFDRWQSERELAESDAMDEMLAKLEAAGHVYEHEGAKWLRTTEHGDAKDRVLVRKDGEPTYFMPDIAFHHQKYDRASHLINVLGADHHGYVARMVAVLRFLGHPPGSYEAIVGQNVTLVRDGEQLELSKRTGTMVEVRDLLDAVGPDVARMAFLLQSIDTRQTIDIDLLTRQANENPVFYVQYAHARIASIGREAQRRGVQLAALADTDLASVDLAVLTEPRELAVLRCLEELPQVVGLALRDRAPHKVTTWTIELATAFHGFYHDCPILRSDVAPDLREARLWLTEAARIGLAIGLDLLGVSAPEEM